MSNIHHEIRNFNNKLVESLEGSCSPNVEPAFDENEIVTDPDFKVPMNNQERSIQYKVTEARCKTIRLAAKGKIQ